MTTPIPEDVPKVVKKEKEGCQTVKLFLSRKHHRKDPYEDQF
jgi:hypothetical protein